MPCLSLDIAANLASKDGNKLKNRMRRAKKKPRFKKKTGL
jgi:hypothetical protein